MTSSHQNANPCQWFSYLTAALDRRSAPRLVWLFLGAVLARGRRTVTSWIRAAGLSRQYQPCYMTIAAAGKQAENIAARLVYQVVKPLVAGQTQLTLALDDTPTQRYGPYVQGAGIHAEIAHADAVDEPQHQHARDEHVVPGPPPLVFEMDQLAERGGEDGDHEPQQRDPADMDRPGDIPS